MALGSPFSPTDDYSMHGTWNDIKLDELRHTDTASDVALSTVETVVGSIAIRHSHSPT